MAEKLEELSKKLTGANQDITSFFSGIIGDYRSLGTSTRSIMESLSDLGVNVRDFGALGDDFSDDTQAFQKAINFCFVENKSLIIPSGVYRILGTINLPRSLKVIGSNQSHEGYSTAQKKSCVIKTYAKSVFIRNSDDLKCSLVMDSVFFQNARSSRDIESDAVLFDDIHFRASNIFGNTFFNYGTVFVGAIQYVSFVHHNHFLGVKRYVLDGKRGAFSADVSGGSLVDSHITNNYINGNASTNATCFRLSSVAMSTISGNYIDYFKFVSNITWYCSGMNIEGNVFDYSYKAFKSDRMGGMTGINISGNTFRRSSKDSALKYFLKPDADMAEGVWRCLEITGATGLVVSNNVVIECDEFLRILGYPYTDLKISGNVYSKVPVRVHFNVAKSSDVDLSNIIIEDLMDIRVDELPDPKQKGSEITTFDKQTVFYKGKKLYNDNGIWKDFMGGGYI